MARLRKLYVPYLLASAGLFVVYSYLNWWLLVDNHWLRLKDEWVGIWFPLILGGTVTYWVMVPILKVFLFSRRMMSFLELAIWLFIAVPIMLGQYYLSDSTSHLTKVDSPSEILSDSQYYVVKNFRIDKASRGFWLTKNSVGRYDTETRLTSYFASPMLHLDSVKLGEQNIWLVWTYAKLLSASKARTKEQIDAFCLESFKEFENHLFDTNLFKIIPYSDKTDAAIEAIKSSPVQYNKDKLILLEEVKEGNRSMEKVSPKWALGSLILGNLLWLFVVLLGKVNRKDYGLLGSAFAKKQAKEERLLWFSFFVPKDEYWAVPVIIDLNLFVFLSMVLSGVSMVHPLTSQLILWGGNYAPLTEGGQWWRLLTSMFIHIGFKHLLYNLLVLGFIGLFMEEEMGRSRFLCLYILSGIVGGLASLYWNENVVSVGASSGIFGLLGYASIILLFRKEYLLFIGLMVYMGVNFALEMYGMVDNSAHLGGFLVGVVLGVVSSLRKEN